MITELDNLDLADKQTIVDLLLAVQAGRISCRRAATEIQKQIPKRHLTAGERDSVYQMRQAGYQVQNIAKAFRISPTTVWRIMQAKKEHSEK